MATPPDDPRAAQRGVPWRLPSARNVGLVAAGGALGAIARAGLVALVPAGAGGWPWATLVANLSGALLLGLLLGVLAESLAGGTWARPLLGTGLLGGYTTFSTLALEIVRLATAGRVLLALGYALTSLTCGLLAVWAGGTLAALLVRAARGTR